MQSAVQPLKSVSLSIGGSILYKERGPSRGRLDVEFIRDLAELPRRYPETQFVFCTGGGKPARSYRDDVKQLLRDPRNSDLDQLGIMLTHVNAYVFWLALREQCRHEELATVRPASFMEFSRLPAYRVTVFGGWQPGVTTDTDAALAAVAHGIKTVVNVSNTAYVYDKDPKRYKTAKPQERLTYAQAEPILRAADSGKPGRNTPFDYNAFNQAKNSGIVVLFVKKSISDIRAAIEGRPHNGTIMATQETLAAREHVVPREVAPVVAEPTTKAP